MNDPRRRDIGYHLTYLVMAAAVLCAALALQIRADGHVVTPIYNIELPGSCWFKHLTGIGCPGCGLTRCFICLAHGNLVQAWHFNPAGLLLFPVVLTQIPYRALQVWRIRHNRTQWRPMAISSVVAYTLAAALLLQWVWRMPY
jgi:hypothetical protein